MSTGGVGTIALNESMRLALNPTVTYLKEFQKQQDWLKAIVEPPMFKHLRDFQRGHQQWLKNIVDPPLLKFQRDLMQEQDRLRKAFEGPLQSVIATLRQADEMQRVLDSPVAKLAKQLQQQKLTLPASPLFLSLQSLQSLSKQYQQSFDAAKYLDLVKAAFPEKVATELLDRVDAIHQELASTSSAPEMILGEELNGIAQLVNEECQRLPRTLISFEAMVSNLLAILMFLYALHASNLSEERIMAQLAADKAEILSAISELYPPVDEKRYFVVDRNVNLRTSPTTKSARFGILYPNQKVLVIKDKKKWLYIEYFDYREGVPRTGWVYKKYLRSFQ